MVFKKGIEPFAPVEESLPAPAGGQGQADIENREVFKVGGSGAKECLCEIPSRHPK